jgi:outer membrane receptor protein involved in Fe transport
MKSMVVCCIAFLLLQVNPGYAQEANGTISGVVKDAGNKVIEGATIVLNRLTDSVVLVKAEVTNSEGQFRFEFLGTGDYTVIVTNVGFDKYTSETLHIVNGNEKMELPLIRLARTENSLAAVTVRGKRSFIERRIDRTVVNVDGAITNLGINTFDVLGKLPGLRLTEEGNISLLGKGVTVYVDGRPTYLSNADLWGYLKSLPADQLDKIELMPNPPARYDAAGTGGIINIITKKNKQQGFNAGLSLNYAQGVYSKPSGSLNINYRVNKVNLFSNIGYGVFETFRDISGTRTYKDEQDVVNAMMQQESFIKNIHKSGTVKLGMDYYLNKKTTLGIIFNGAYRPATERGNNWNRVFNPANMLDSTVYSQNNSDNTWRNGTVNVNMVHQFDSTGKELSIDIDVAHYNMENEQSFENNTFDAGNNWKNRDLLTGDLPRTIDIYSAKLDYNFSLKNGIKIGTGVKTSFVKTDNRANYFTEIGGVKYPDYTRTNSFLYDENINAFYLEGYKEYKRFGIKAGIRLEQTNAKGRQLGNVMQKDSSFTRDYVNAFPTFFFSYKFDTTNTNQLFINYGRRIRRPSYDQLNPFLSLIQKYYQEAGNPYLSPEFANTVEVTHVYKERLTTNAYYSYVSNNFNGVVDVVDDVYISRPGNIGRVGILGIMLSFNKDVTKWWNADMSFNPERTHLKSVFNGISVDSSFFIASFNLFNRFNFKNDWSAELAFNWGSRSYTGQYVNKGIAAMSAGVKKQLFSNMGSIGLNVSDIFYSAIRRGEIVKVPRSEATFREPGDTRVVTLSFNYRFGKNLNKTKNPRDRSGVYEEQNRVK